jgi:hypothetical protein
MLALACWWLVAIRAQVPEPQPPATSPELDFLEYLGAWAEDDDEWLAIEEWQKDIAEPDGIDEESENEREDDDESE